ncbi:MAG TPA: hypothetical protein VIY86_07870, partial [Pirellulaceae bacterium]
MARPLDASFHPVTGEPHLIVGLATSVELKVLTVNELEDSSTVSTEFRGHRDQILNAACSRDGRWLVSISRDGTTRVWDRRNSAWRRVWRTPEVTCVGIRSDGQKVVTGQRDGTTTLWDISRDEPDRVFPGDATAVTAVVFSPNGDCLAAGEERGAVRIWRLEGDTTSISMRVEPSQAKVTSLAFGPLRGQFAVGTGDHRLFAYEMQHGPPADSTPKLRLSLQGHSGPILGIAYSPDGKRIVSGSEDSSAKIWDADTGAEALTLIGRSDHVRRVLFSPDGDSILTLGGGTNLWRSALPHRHSLPVHEEARHRMELAECERERHWFGVRWHADWLIKNSGEAPDLFWRRGDALAELGEWSAADVDFSAALA